jgi:hypothetical protein
VSSIFRPMTDHRHRLGVKGTRYMIAIQTILQALPMPAARLDRLHIRAHLRWVSWWARRLLVVTGPVSSSNKARGYCSRVTAVEQQATTEPHCSRKYQPPRASVHHQLRPLPVGPLWFYIYFETGSDSLKMRRSLPPSKATIEAGRGCRFAEVEDRQGTYREPRSRRSHRRPSFVICALCFRLSLPYTLRRWWQRFPLLPEFCWAAFAATGPCRHIDTL